MDKRKVLTQILGADPREKLEGVSEQDALEVLTGELLEAFQSGDAKGAASALRAAFMECGRDNSPPPSGDAPTEG